MARLTRSTLVNITLAGVIIAGLILPSSCRVGLRDPSMAEEVSNVRQIELTLGSFATPDLRQPDPAP